MIVQWLSVAPVVLVAATIAFVPGLLSLAAAGMRGLALMAFAPVMSTALASLSAVLLGAVGIQWSLWSFAAVIFLVSVLAWLIGHALPLRQHRATPAARRWVLPSALTVGAIIGFWRLAAYIHDPSAISQTNDAVFHLNALRYIIDTGSASSFDVNGFIGASGFYPAAWHALASLVAMSTGASIPVTANALTVVIGGLIWPFGIAWLTRAITGSNSIAGYAAVLSGALQGFPLLLFQWGVLYPNALSVALIPAGIALVLLLPSWARDAPRWRGLLQGLLFVAITVCALVFAQPASVLIFGLLCMIRFTWWLISPSTASAGIRWLSVTAGWIGLAAIWVFFSRSTGGAHWPPFRDKLVVWADVLVNGQLMMAPAWGISALMAVGLVVAVRRARWRWFAVSWLAVSALYILVATFGLRIVRDGLLGPWYADPYRIVALAPIVVIPLAAIGVDALARIVTARVRQGTEARAGVPSVIALALVTVLVLALVVARPVAMPDFIAGRFEPDPRYEESDHSYLSVDERDLLESLRIFVDDDARVIGNPSTGMGFGYLFSGVDVFPRTWSPPATTEWQSLASALRDAATDPAVCEALQTYGSPEYVLDFGLGEAYAGRYEMPGMTNFAGQEGFELITENGDASLWRITACAL